MRPRRIVVTAILVATAGVGSAVALPALARTGPKASPQPPASAPAVTAKPSNSASAEQAGGGLTALLAQELGVTAAEADKRVRREDAQVDLATRASTTLGDKFGGAWLDATTGQLKVAVTDQAAAKAVTALGALPAKVARSARQLSAAQNRLDTKVKSAPATVKGWFVSPAHNAVTVMTAPGGEAAAKAFAVRAGLSPDTVRTQTVSTNLTTFAFDVRGGDKYVINRSARCSVGFAVTTGFVTAGHCGQKGSTTTGFNNAAQGTFTVSKFGNSGGNDYAAVKVNGSWKPKAVVQTANGPVAVRGSKAAPVNTRVCRTGSTTGTRCGKITARNASVNVSGRLVKNFIVTDACAAPGDSGGSLITAAGQAQGTLTGGGGSCGGRAVTVYQPLNPVLQAEKLKLVTTSGAQPAPSPTTPKPTAKPKPKATPKPTATPKPSTGGLTATETAVFKIVNQERAKAGCGALKVDATLVKAARGHSQDMAKNNYFSHTDRQGRQPAQRVTAAGYHWRMTGENIAAGQRTAAEVMKAWMNSSGHRANILRCEYRDIGIGVASRKNGGSSVLYWTQVFGTKA